MSFFIEYYNAFNSKEELGGFIKNNFNRLYDYYGLLNHNDLIKKRNDFSQLSLKVNVINDLDFTNQNNVSYLNLILKTAIRLGDFFVFQQFYRVLISKNLEESFLIKSASLFMSAINIRDFINPYDNIVMLLERSFSEESDTNDEPISLYINYYSLFVKYFSEFAKKEVKFLNEKIKETYNSDEYGFLKDNVILKILDINIDFSNSPYDKIQIVLDQFLGRKRALSNFQAQFLIEEGTAYANTLNTKPHTILDLLQLNKNEYSKIKNNAIYNSLGRGTAILENEAQLLAYMYAFGNMHYTKLQEAINILPSEISDFQLIDWGCGQGLASKLFLEKFGSTEINSLTLIEPSNCAIKRASLHLKNDVRNITTICKDFDSLDFKDFENLKPSNKYVHLFSNIIDVELFSLTNLIELVNKTFEGENYFVVVSPKINITRTTRINEFINSIVNGRKHDFLLKEDKSSGDWIKTWSKVLRVVKVSI